MMMKPRHLEKIYHPTDKEGYDGLICGEGIPAPDEMLDDFITKTDNLFEIKMFLEYQGREDFLVDVVNDTYLLQDGFHFTVDDRANIWHSVAIELKGVQSGMDYKDFVIEELA